MKKTLLSMLALTLMGGGAWAGGKPVISVADVQALPGETVSFAVTLVDGKADTYTAMTLYAYFPAEGFTTTDNYTVADVWEGTMGVVGDIDTTTGLATIPFASANAIPGLSVTDLVTVSFKVDESVALGSYHVTLKGTMFEYNLSDKDYADDVTFTVEVVDRITLDEESATLPTTRDGVDVLVRRKMTAGEWNAICLPFTMDEEQLKAAFGDGVRLGYFDGYDADGDQLKVNFGTIALSDGLEANQPYIIKPSVAVETFDADHVDIEADEENAFIRVGGTKSNPKSLFTGTLKAGTAIPEDNLFISDSQFYSSTGSTVIKGFCGYFYLRDFSSSAGAADILLNVDGETTKIEGLRMVAEDGRFYDLGGMQTESPTRKGVCIHHGKKMVVK